MSDISLLPVGYRNYREAKRRKKMLIMTAIILFVICLMSYIMISVLNMLYTEELNTLKIEKTQVKKMIDSKQVYRDKHEQLKEYEKMLNTAMDNMPEWSIALVDISLSLPYGVWLEDIDLRYENNVINCTLRGKASGIDVTAQWLSNLGNLSYVKNVSCEYINKLDESSESLNKDETSLQFEVKADISGSELSKETENR